MTGYNKIKPRKFDKGGFVEENAEALAGGANLVADSLMMLGNPKKANVGLSTASGALKGAAQGAMIGGPIGALAGGVLGGVTSFIGSSKEKKELERQEEEAIIQAKKNQLAISSSNLAGYDTNGVQGVQYYKRGGVIPMYTKRSFAYGGVLPDDPIKTVKTINKPRAYQPDITLPNWDGLVQKDDGSIGMWGNDIVQTTPTVITPVVQPEAKTDHVGRQSGQYYQGSKSTSDKIFEMEKRLKAASNMKGFRKGGFLPCYAKGGPIGNYEVERDEVVQGNAQLEDATGIASDLQVVNGATHEGGGVQGVGGERVFSDSMKIGDELATVLKDLKISTSVKPSATYAKAAEIVGRRKGKMEDKINSHFAPSITTGKLMMSRLDTGLDILFDKQEESKVPRLPKPSYDRGGILPRVNDRLIPFTGGEITTPDQLAAYNVIPKVNQVVPETFMGKAGNFIKENEGQLLNLGSYLGNMASIRKLDTTVKTRYGNTPQYNYTDRSGLAKADNQAMLNSTLKALGSSSQGVNASNAGALYGETLNKNNAITNAENNRRDSYDQNFAERSDRMSLYNAQFGNAASAEQRELNNYKNVEAPLAARNTFMQGYAGNKAVQAQKNLDNKQALLTATALDENGALSRLAKKMGFKDVNDFITNYVSK